MANAATKTALIKATPVPLLERRICVLRGQKVMLDEDLAELYDVPTKRLNEQVRRNRSRFPKDFMFRLTRAEVRNLRSQIATSSWGGRRTAPLAFTEHGVAMLSAVLNSDRAVRMSLMIIRAFVKLRKMLASQAEMAHRLRHVEHEQKEHGTTIRFLADEIEEMKALPEPGPKRRMGF